MLLVFFFIQPSFFHQILCLLKLSKKLSCMYLKKNYLLCFNRWFYTFSKVFLLFCLINRCFLNSFFFSTPFSSSSSLVYLFFQNCALFFQNLLIFFFLFFQFFLKIVFWFFYLFIRVIFFF